MTQLVEIETVRQQVEAKKEQARQRAKLYYQRNKEAILAKKKTQYKPRKTKRKIPVSSKDKEYFRLYYHVTKTQRKKKRDQLLKNKANVLKDQIEPVEE